MRDMMTPQQVAEYLQLTTETVYRLIRRKELAAAKIGRAYRIPREDLEQFLTVYSSREAVRRALLARVNAIAERNSGVDGDELLQELEREDARTRRATS